MLTLLLVKCIGLDKIQCDRDMRDSVDDMRSVIHDSFTACLVIT